MAQIITQFPDFDITFEVVTNPEIILMLAQGDIEEAEATESQWFSAKLVTKPKHSNYSEE